MSACLFVLVRGFLSLFLASNHERTRDQPRVCEREIDKNDDDDNTLQAKSCGNSHDRDDRDDDNRDSNTDKNKKNIRIGLCPSLVLLWD